MNSLRLVALQDGICLKLGCIDDSHNTLDCKYPWRCACTLPRMIRRFSSRQLNGQIACHEPVRRERDPHSQLPVSNWMEIRIGSSCQAVMEAHSDQCFVG